MKNLRLKQIALWALGVLLLLAACGLASVYGEYGESLFLLCTDCFESYFGHFFSDLPANYHPQTTADAIDYWQTRPSIAFVASIILTLAALVVAIAFPKQRRLAMILISITVVRHLYWRTFYTLDFDNTASAVVGILLYFAELYGVISILLGCFQMYRPIKREASERVLKEGFVPSVDVLIPSYNEPLDVLFRTVVGCMHMDYPNKRVFLLDDGNRDEVREMCEQLGCEYLRREKNIHAKAGNLNNGLKYSASSLVVVFDADHVPVRNFLTRTVPHFVDKKLAYVQTPQHFCTPDPFQRNLIVENDLANEQDLFYHVILPGVDSLGAVTFAGSGTVFRREALEDIDGFATETVTEDIHTGLRLHDRGWKSFYVNEDLSAGLAPETFEDFLNQRIRWAQGATQVFIIEGVLQKTGLTLLQKLSYFNALWYFLQGLPRMIFLIIPLAYLLFGVVTIQAYYLDVLTYYLCYFIVCSVAYTQMSGQVRQTQWSELYETVLCFHLSLITFLTFLNPRDAEFKVTPKGENREGITFAGVAVLPHMIVFVLTLIGMGMGVYRAINDPASTGLMLWNEFWAGYNLILLICALLVAFNRPQKRQSPRVNRDVDVEVSTVLASKKSVRGVTSNLSEGGARLILDEPVPVKDNFPLKILDWTLKRQSTLICEPIQSHVDDLGRHHVSVRFVDIEPEIRENLVLHIFSDPDTWAGYHQVKGVWVSLAKLIKTPIRWLKAKESARRRLAPRFVFESPCTLTDREGNLYALGLVNDMSETGVSVQMLKNYEPLPLLRRLTLRMEWPDSEHNPLVSEAEKIFRKKLGKDFGKNFKQAKKPFIQELTVEVLRQSPNKNDGDEETQPVYNLIFRDLKTEQNRQIQEFLYERNKLPLGSVNDPINKPVNDIANDSIKSLLDELALNKFDSAVVGEISSGHENNNKEPIRNKGEPRAGPSLFLNPPTRTEKIMGAIAKLLGKARPSQKPTPVPAALQRVDSVPFGLLLMKVAGFSLDEEKQSGLSKQKRWRGPNV